MQGSANYIPQEAHPNQEFIGTLSGKSMITLPVEVRKFLGVRPKDKVVFKISDQAVEIKPGPMTLEDTMGSVPALASPKEWKQMMEEVKEERAEQFINKMNL